MVFRRGRSIDNRRTTIFLVSYSPIPLNARTHTYKGPSTWYPAKILIYRLLDGTKIIHSDFSFSSYKYRIPLFGRESFENKSTQEPSPIVTRGLKNKIHVGFPVREETEREGVIYLGAK